MVLSGKGKVMWSGSGVVRVCGFLMEVFVEDMAGVLDYSLEELVTSCIAKRGKGGGCSRVETSSCSFSQEGL